MLNVLPYINETEGLQQASLKSAGGGNGEENAVGVPRHPVDGIQSVIES